MKKITELQADLDWWQVKTLVKDGRIHLSGGDKRAREYYEELLLSHQKIEAHLILELARKDEDLMFSIEERAAIRESEGLPGDLFTAILCNITN